MANGSSWHAVVERGRGDGLTWDVVRVSLVGPETAGEQVVEDSSGVRWAADPADVRPSRDEASRRLRERARETLRFAEDAARAGDPGASVRHAQVLVALGRFERAEGVFDRDRAAFDRDGSERVRDL